MKNVRTLAMIFFILFFFAATCSVFTQQRTRAPWKERSPAVGKKLKELMVYDKDLNKIPLSNLYKDTILILQWGGCT
jgi:hypothetical protein